MAKRARTWGSLDTWGASDRSWGAAYGALEPFKREYHVVLGGRGLILADGGWERGLAEQFAAPFRTSSPSAAGRVGLEAVEVTGWIGGEGQLRHEPGANAVRFRRGGGINIYDEPGAVSLGPYAAAHANLQTSFNSITAMGVYRNYLMLGRDDGKVYRWDGSTLDLAGDTGKSTGGITCFGVFENNLYIGNGQDGAVWRWLGTTLLTNFASNFTVGAYSGGTVEGVYALSNHMRGNFYSFFYGAKSTNAGLTGEAANTGGTTDPADSSTLITPDFKISVLLPYGDDILAVSVNETARYSRLYDGNDADPVVWSLEVARIQDCLITCGAVLGDHAYFGDSIQGRIWRWDGDQFELYRQLGSDLLPYTASITGMAAWRGRLYISIVDTDSSMAVLCDNGDDDWSRPITGLTGTTPGPVAVYSDQLHVATNATGAAKVFRTNGTFAASGYVESAMFDASLPGHDKLWRSLVINHSALVSGQSVTVQYQLDNAGSWVTLGASSTVGATSDEFNFGSAVSSKLIGIKVTMAGSAGSSSALQVFDFSLRFRLPKGAAKQWTLRVRLEGPHEDTPHSRHLTLLDENQEELSGEQLSDAIWALIDADEPVHFLDVDREEQYEVMIDTYQESLSTIAPNIGSAQVGYNLQGQLTLKEV